MGEILFHIFLMVVVGGFYKETFKINVARMTDPIGAAGFPKGIIYLLFAFLTFSLIICVKNYIKSKMHHEPKKKIDELDPALLTIVGSIIAYVLLVNTIGFFVSSALLIAIILFVLDIRDVVKATSITIGAALVFTFMFGKILNVPLPRGIGFLEVISHFIY